MIVLSLGCSFRGELQEDKQIQHKNNREAGNDVCCFHYGKSEPGNELGICLFV